MAKEKPQGLVCVKKFSLDTQFYPTDDSLSIEI